MAFLQTISVRVRLTFVPVLGVVISIMIGVVGITAVSNVNDPLADMYDNNLLPTADLGNSNMAAIYHNRTLLTYVIETKQAEMEKIGLKMTAIESHMNALINKYRKTELTPPETDLLGKFDKAWPPYAASAKRVMAFSYADKNAEAMLEFQTVAAPAFQVADDILGAIYDLNIELGKKNDEEEQASTLKARMLFIGSMAVGAAVLLVVSLTIAGEQGRGFAVVASEVRALAGRSADAAREIKSLINASVERVEQGTFLVNSAGATMTRVVESIQRVTQVMGEIRAASSEQSAGVTQVSDTVVQMDQATQQNATQVEEMTAASTSLESQARDLVEIAAVFKFDAGDAGYRTSVQLANSPARKPMLNSNSKLQTPSRGALLTALAPFAMPKIYD